MVGLAALLSLGLAGAAAGAGYSAQAMAFAPITDYYRGYSWAYGMGQGMWPGMQRNAAYDMYMSRQRRQQELIDRRQDRLFNLQTSLLKWGLEWKLRQYENRTSVPKRRYRIVF
jgi:hypothetical protein